MSDVVVRIDNLGKRYRIGATQSKTSASKRLDVRRIFASPFKYLASTLREPTPEETLWALRNVSFEVNRGEIVGIIGRNGAGKSTLLKLLTGITKPTEGKIWMRGHVGSLLEVGTGFHPELTGRENVYLNGAILGMKRAEIERKFDEIVAFSEVERFLDTPVKRYSSGMYMRLAFAVAAHLDPGILLVDEVLAVGDASFQKKCLNKMESIGHEGRTVLFVSHNMAAVSRLCPRVVLLDKGQVVQDGPLARVIDAYLQIGLERTSERLWPDQTTAPGNEIVRLRSLRARTEDGQTSSAMDIRFPIGIEMEYDVLQPGLVLVPNYHVFNEEGVYLFVAHDIDPAWSQRPRPVGHYTSTVWIPGNFLAEGTLTVGAAISTMDPVRVYLHEQEAIAFQVVDSMEGNTARGEYAASMPGVIRPLLRWETQYSPLSDRIAPPITAQ